MSKSQIKRLNLQRVLITVDDVLERLRSGVDVPSDVAWKMADIISVMESNYDQMCWDKAYNS